MNLIKPQADITNIDRSRYLRAETVLVKKDDGTSQRSSIYSRFYERSSNRLIFNARPISDNRYVAEIHNGVTPNVIRRQDNVGCKFPVTGHMCWSTVSFFFFLSQTMLFFFFLYNFLQIISWCSIRKS